MKVVSLFDGISCGMVALERAGISIEKYDAYEIEESAIKISSANYPQINHKGNVFNASYNVDEYDLLIGGSPCTYWSIARHPDERETEASGIGYELFMEYVRCLREAKPKYFLYENNASMSKQIKDAITQELGVQPIMINSSLVSAQSRKRLYWTNIEGVEIPDDRNIKLYDAIDFNTHEFRDVGNWVYSKWGGVEKIKMLKTVKSEKSHTLTTSKTHSMAYYCNESRTQYTNLSVEDFEILQTLPVGYVSNVSIPEGKKYKAIGNGWTIDVITHILSYLRKE